MSDTDTKKDFNQNYLADKLHSIGDKLGDAYGEPLLNELIARMELLSGALYSLFFSLIFLSNKSQSKNLQISRR